MKRISAILAINALQTMFIGGLFAADRHAIQSPEPGTRRSVKAVYSLETNERIHQAYTVLERTDDGVCLVIDTAELAPGAYTAWWILFNVPQECQNPRPVGQSSCSGADVNNPSVEATVMWAASSVVGPDGTAHFSSCIGIGELTHAVLPLGVQQGLLDPLGAEIQLEIRNHGPAEYENPMLFGEQLTTFNGGCETETQMGFACQNLQFVVHGR